METNNQANSSAGFSNSNTQTPANVSQASTDLPTYPDLIMYALSVYAFYFAARKAKEDISSDDPLAHGLFKRIPLTYRQQPTKIDPSSSELTSIGHDIMTGESSSDPAVREFFGEVVQQIDGPEEENPVENHPS